jgi:hypothetical protein
MKKLKITYYIHTLEVKNFGYAADLGRKLSEPGKINSVQLSLVFYLVTGYAWILASDLSTCNQPLTTGK